MLAVVDCAQNVGAVPRASAAATPPQAERVSRWAVRATSASVSAPVTAAKRLTRQAGVFSGSSVKSLPITVYSA